MDEVRNRGPWAVGAVALVVFLGVFLAADRQQDPGTGIGLSLVSRFAELHGGRAWVQDRAGGGASFHVFLPSVQEAKAS